MKPLPAAGALGDKAVAAASALFDLKTAKSTAEREIAAIEFFASSAHAAADRIFFGHDGLSDAEIVKLIELTQATIRTELGELLPGVERKVPRYIYARLTFLEEHVENGGTA